QAGRAQRDQAEQARHQRGAEESRRRGDPVAEPELQPEQRRGIRRDAEIRRMAERRQPAVAEQQVDARREDGEDEDLAGEVDIELTRKQRNKGKKNEKPEQLHAANLPNSPRGRKAMTKIIGRKR